jgi:hypothetical protein
MNISEGFGLEQPPVLLRWGASEEELCALLPEARRVASGCLGSSGVSLGGLTNLVGLYLRPKEGGGLAEISLARTDYRDWLNADFVVSFNDFQSHLEATFGPSTETRPGDLGTTSHLWRIGGVVIVHMLNYRFGIEEYVRIKGPGQPPFGATPGDHILWA